MYKQLVATYTRCNVKATCSNVYTVYVLSYVHNTLFNIRAIPLVEILGHHDINFD